MPFNSILKINVNITKNFFFKFINYNIENIFVQYSLYIDIFIQIFIYNFNFTIFIG